MEQAARRRYISRLGSIIWLVGLVVGVGLGVAAAVGLLELASGV